MANRLQNEITKQFFENAQNVSTEEEILSINEVMKEQIPDEHRQNLLTVMIGTYIKKDNLKNFSNILFKIPEVIDSLEKIDLTKIDTKDFKQNDIHKLNANIDLIESYSRKDNPYLFSKISEIKENIKQNEEKVNEEKRQTMIRLIDKPELKDIQNILNEKDLTDLGGTKIVAIMNFIKNNKEAYKLEDKFNEISIVMKDIKEKNMVCEEDLNTLVLKSKVKNIKHNMINNNTQSKTNHQ